MVDFAIIVPTYNEKGNVSELAKRLEKLFAGKSWELIFVDDDSKDGTLDELHTLARQYTYIRYIRRVGRRGLASACVEGMLSTTATYLAVMDADLQHDENKLLQMFDLLQSKEANLVVGSRYLEEGGMGSWDAKRVGISRFATTLAHKCMQVPCSDPMSGFFALHRDIIDTVATKIQVRGFKILFDILTQPNINLTIKEVPYVFKERQVGETKLGVPVILDFLRLLLFKYASWLIHIEFIMFCLVGLLGVLVHLVSLYIFLHVFGFSFLAGQSLATLIAMFSNYVCNNLFTFQEKRLRGKAFAIGFGKFGIACALGAFVNIATADFLNDHGLYWLLSATSGVVIGSIINFFFARYIVWRKN